MQQKFACVMFFLLQNNKMSHKAPFVRSDHIKIRICVTIYTCSMAFGKISPSIIINSRVIVCSHALEPLYKMLNVLLLVNTGCINLMRS